MAAPPPPPSPARLLWRGVTKRCPVCGSRGLFVHYFRAVERCPGCDLRLHRHEGQMTGEIGVNTIVTFALLFVLLMGSALGVGGPPRYAVLIPVGLLLTLGFPVFFLPYSKTICLAFDLLTHPLEPGESRAGPATPGAPPGRADDPSGAARAGDA